MRFRWVKENRALYVSPKGQRVSPSQPRYHVASHSLHESQLLALASAKSSARTEPDRSLPLATTSNAGGATE
ncbi:hypothetical protein N7509_003925 [Penicillium cosmopolitanum]|uniref:Uncharacterized protein n=1 Tax=Penicillium cosmopolitanum TaxID=1131564 RepID=A0A9X0BBX9_9EURO|nr:uncharacterized protein N7509_003925 [Penicillium cosmopolitanum]KAJ5404054.1 hypothetical protein N7509_003925 [Penicillium cosmopolitanum]